MSKPWILLACLLCFSAAARAAAPSFELVPGERAGNIRANSTQADIEKAYGAGNVKAGDVYLGEGEVGKGLVVFSNDPKRKADLVWKEAGKGPKHILFNGTRSLWKTAEGISLGMTLKALEKLNGKPFTLAGFEWDYSGTVLSWEGGKLAFLEGKLILRLNNNLEAEKLTEQEKVSVLGDKGYPSSHPVMQKLNPVVYQMVFNF